VLGEDGIVIQFVDGKYRFARGMSENGSLKLIGYADVEKCLDDFVTHIKSKMRMSFWEKEGGQYKWTPSPEKQAKILLDTALSIRFGDSAYIFEEVGAGAGRVDIYIVTPLGEKFIIELKMCGAPYSESYAKGGVEQLLHYMENRQTKIGYLIVFDSRKRDFSQGFREGAVTINGKCIITKIVDVRPFVR
jgi:hypothetical protein